MSTPDESSSVVDPAVEAMRPTVRDALRRVERERNLRVVFACESGSRAWGFASDDSDFDVRFIFVRPAAEYLRLRPPTDAFDLMGIGHELIDLAGWDIRKTAELMRKSNGPLFEWLDSPIIYERDDRVSPRLIELSDVYFDPKKAMYHYLSLAAGVWKKYLADRPTCQRKKYLYTLRPIACIKYIEANRSQPPTRFESMLAAIELPEDVRQSIDSLVADKKANRELGEGPADPVLHAWIERALIDGDSAAAAMPPSSENNAALDALVADAILGEGT